MQSWLAVGQSMEARDQAHHHRHQPVSLGRVSAAPLESASASGCCAQRAHGRRMLACKQGTEAKRPRPSLRSALRACRAAQRRKKKRAQAGRKKKPHAPAAILVCQRPAGRLASGPCSCGSTNHENALPARRAGRVPETAARQDPGPPPPRTCAHASCTCAPACKEERHAQEVDRVQGRAILVRSPRGSTSKAAKATERRIDKGRRQCPAAKALHRRMPFRPGSCCTRPGSPRSRAPCVPKPTLGRRHAKPSERPPARRPEAHSRGQERGRCGPQVLAKPAKPAKAPLPCARARGSSGQQFGSTDVYTAFSAGRRPTRCLRPDEGGRISCA